jgi:hypothetical protein
MLCKRRIAATLAAAIAFSANPMLAQSADPHAGPRADGAGPTTSHGMGPGMGHGMGRGMGQGPGASRGAMQGPTAMLTKQDANSSSDMALVMDLVHSNDKIKRTVTLLPNGIRTITESDDPKIAQTIQAHVASMASRLQDGREFNIFSTTLPVIFDNANRIDMSMTMTAKGVIVTRTATDAQLVAALQAHAGEVTELVRDGSAGMRRGMMARMAMGPEGPRGAISTKERPGNRTLPPQPHAH